MAEAAQNRVQTAVKDFINAIDRSKLRVYERSMHLCAANCCEDQQASVEDVHRCIAKCQEPTQRAQQYVQSELERFQDMLQRCVSSCQDDVKDKVKINTPESELKKYRAEFESCAIACCDKNIAKLPTLLDKVKDAFDSGAL